MVKKRSTSTRAKYPHKHITHSKTHIMLKKGIVVYAVLVFLFFVLVSMSALVVVETYQAVQNRQRLDTINGIYSSLNLDKSYRNAGHNVFGDKRVYDWDHSRSYASTMEFGRDASRNETFQDLQKRITAAGFTQIQGPDYGDGPQRQDHYKNDEGQYIRVSIESKAWHDSMLYGVEFPKLDDAEQQDKGPVFVTIKVNIDDNNE